MQRGSRSSLKAIFNRFVFGVILAVIASWALAGLRFDPVLEFLLLEEGLQTLKTLDYLFLGIAGFGLLIALLILPQLISRIGRVSSLGEQKW